MHGICPRTHDIPTAVTVISGQVRKRVRSITASRESSTDRTAPAYESGPSSASAAGSYAAGRSGPLSTVTSVRRGWAVAPRGWGHDFVGFAKAVDHLQRGRLNLVAGV